MPFYFDYQRINDGVSLTGKFGESLQLTERWQIKVDSPGASRVSILSEVTGTIGVTWGSSHPELSELKAMEFSLTPSGRDGLRWVLEVKYYIPPPGKVFAENGLPEDIWERAGGTTTVPAFYTIDDPPEPIANSAGDPLEGLEREREEASWTLTRAYVDDDALQSAIDLYAGKVNDAIWAGGDEKTWKCYFKSAKRGSISKLDGDDDAGTLEYVEAQWEFRYDPGTWKLMPWDVGFAQLNGSGDKVAITTDDGKTVKQPVALNSDGSARTPPDPPLVANNGDGFDVYETADFDTGFGEPGILGGS